MGNFENPEYENRPQYYAFPAGKALPHANSIEDAHVIPRDDMRGDDFLPGPTIRPGASDAISGEAQQYGGPPRFFVRDEGFELFNAALLGLFADEMTVAFESLRDDNLWPVEEEPSPGPTTITLSPDEWREEQG